jgi:hypothetical protein
MAKDAVTAGLKKIGELSSDERSLFQLREELCEALRREGKRILVIIDDVDRLPADELRQIFRLVKSVGDLPNVIHLLIFDREIAKRALGEPDNGAGSEWYEKIVQASFDLPPVHPVDVHQLFLEGLGCLIGSVSPPDQIRWANVFYDAIAPWLRTPRDAGRLLNALVVSWPAVAGDVDLADFVALETLRLFEPPLHSPEKLTGLTHGLHRADQELGEKLLALVDPSKQDQVKEALQRLFPKLERVWSNRDYGSDFLSRCDRGRRVCINTRFPAYFGFRVGDDALPDEELKDFIAHITDRQYVPAKVTVYANSVRRVGGTKAAVLLEELISNVELIPVDSIPAAIINLFDAADLFANPIDERGGGSLFIPAIWRFWFLIKSQLERLDEPGRAEAMRTAVDTAGSLSGLCFALTVFRASLGRDPEAKPEDAGAPLVDAAVFEDLEGKLRTRLRKASEDGSLLAGPGLIDNLVQWVRLGDEGAVRTWTDRLLNDDAGVLRLAAAATQVSRMSTTGDRVVRQIPTVHRPTLEKVVNVERMLGRLNAMAQVKTEPEVLGVINRFLEGLKPSSPFSIGGEQEGD